MIKNYLYFFQLIKIKINNIVTVVQARDWDF